MNYSIFQDRHVAKNFEKTFEVIVTIENIYYAWNDFIKGKRKRSDVNGFALRIVDNLSELHIDLMSGRYVHGVYDQYVICDPKKRIIHKASVRDRVLHRLLYNALYSYFDNHFIFDSYSCRYGKGAHKARARFRQFVNKVSRNHTKSCLALKFDIKKCFESIDQCVLKNLLRKHVSDEKLLYLLHSVVGSFSKGLPLGNLTSQLFINIYLHELDWYCKHQLNIRYYLRYADDIVIVGNDRRELEELFCCIQSFVVSQLHLTLHKNEIRSIYGGVDILGEVFFKKYKRLRRSTEKRIVLRKQIQAKITFD